MDVIGHRGDGAGRYENTLRGVDAALAAGADGVEVDVRLTSDGVAVCAHDPTLRRVARVGLAVRDTPYEWLARITVDGEPVAPRLEEVIDCVRGRGRLVAEVKRDLVAHRPVTAVTVAAVLTRLGMPDAVISSFDPASLSAARAVDPARQLALLTCPATPVRRALRIAHALGCAEVHPHVCDLRAPDVQANRARLWGLRLVAWSAESAAVARLAADGVVGVICDDVAGALRAVGRLPSPAAALAE